MQGPYRERVCGVCGANGASLVECSSCRCEVCAPCLQEGACRTCVDRALELVLRRLATHGPGPLTPHARPSRLVTGLRIASVALLSAMALAVIPRALRMPPAPPATAAAVFQPTLFPQATAPAPASVIELDSPLVRNDIDPEALWERATSLAVAGAPITCVDARVSFQDFEARPWEREILEIGMEAAQKGELYEAPGTRRVRLDEARGTRIARLDPSSFLASLGLRAGDVITSVDGHRLSDLRHRKPDARRALIEISRGTRHVLFGIEPPGRMK